MRAFAGWFALALLVRGLTAAAVTDPGFVDAAYALHVAAQLVAGQGLTEEVVWNSPHPAGRACCPGRATPTGPPDRPCSPPPGGPAAGRPAPVAPRPGAPRARRRPARRRHLRPRRAGGARRRSAAGATAAALVLGGGIYFPYWVTADGFTPFALVGGVACVWLAARAPATAPAGGGVRRRSGGPSSAPVCSRGWPRAFGPTACCCSSPRWPSPPGGRERAGRARCSPWPGPPSGPCPCCCAPPHLGNAVPAGRRGGPLADRLRRPVPLRRRAGRRPLAGRRPGAASPPAARPCWPTSACSASPCSTAPCP